MTEFHGNNGKKAKVYNRMDESSTKWVVEMYINNRVVQKMFVASKEQAEILADHFVVNEGGGQTLLREYV